MSIAWALLRAVCAIAVIAAVAAGHGGSMARAQDAPAAAPGATEPGKTSPSKTSLGKTTPGKTISGKTSLDKTATGKTATGKTATSAASRKPAKAETGKVSVPSPPTKPGLAHPAGWPAAPVDGAPADRRDAAASPLPHARGKSEESQNSASPAAEAPAEAEEQNFFQRMIRARTRALEPEPNDPKRRDLAEPPDGYRHSTQDPSEARNEEANKSAGILGAIGSLWNGGGPTGKTNDSGGATSAPKPAPDASETGGLLGKISGMLPGFLRGSDKK